MKFTEGEEVFAKPPNAPDYQKGVIMSMRGERYKILFENGTEHNVYENDIKVERSSRSTARTGTRTARKSPSRYSPSRRSPSRRSPARSPTSRNRKLPTRSTRLAKVSSSRTDSSNVDSNQVKSASSEESSTESMPLQSRLREIEAMPRRSMRLSASRRTVLSSFKAGEEHELIITRNIERAVSLPVERKAQLYNFVSEEKERGHSVLRDQDLLKTLDYKDDSQDEEIVEKRKKDINLISKPQEWGGWCGTILLLFALPLGIIIPQIACFNAQCNIANMTVTSDLTFIWDPTAFVSYLGFLLLSIIISLLPIGKCRDGQQTKVGIFQYRMNGFLCAVTALIIFAVCTYKNMPISDFILDKCVQLSFSGWLIASILAVLLYMKASRVCVADLNIYASTDSTIYNFWQGREVNPRIKSFDFKLILLRASAIGVLIIDTAVLAKILQTAESIDVNRINIPAVVVTTLQMLYALDFLIFESTVLTSFGVLYEGTGYMYCVGHLLYPFLATLTPRYLLYQKVKFNYFSGILVLSFILGYVLYRKSNSQKSEFRTNPFAPALAHLESIPTLRGKKLIISGLWGYVRHPNYLGDIIMHWSLACMTMSNDLLPYYSAICCTLALMYRAIRDNARCKARYGFAWEQYCTRVKSMIFRHIF